MKKFPKDGIVGNAIRAADYMGRLKIGLHAANACYFIVLAVFPALLLLLGLLSSQAFLLLLCAALIATLYGAYNKPDKQD